MPSHRYISTKRGHVRIHGLRVGGSVPVLLSNVEKVPEQNGSSNQIVGIITPQPAKAVVEGGKLLKHIHFGSHPKKDNERIKFIF